jgi:hypothetical protein
MNTNIFAYTAPSGQYPGYVSINRTPEGDVEVTVRSAPKIQEGSYICGFARDKGQHGRCTPGDSFCNNYCNMAPEKGPMQDHPLPCTQVFEGKTSVFTVPADQWTFG